MQRKYEKTRKSMIARHSSHWWELVEWWELRKKNDYSPTPSITLSKSNYWWENLFVNGLIKK